MCGDRRKEYNLNEHSTARHVLAMDWKHVIVATASLSREHPLPITRLSPPPLVVCFLTPHLLGPSALIVSFNYT